MLDGRGTVCAALDGRGADSQANKYDMTDSRARQTPTASKRFWESAILNFNGGWTSTTPNSNSDDVKQIGNSTVLKFNKSELQRLYYSTNLKLADSEFQQFWIATILIGACAMLDDLGAASQGNKHEMTDSRARQTPTANKRFWNSTILKFIETEILSCF